VREKQNWVLDRTVNDVNRRSPQEKR